MSDEERFAEARHKHRSDMTTIFIYERSSHKNSQFAYQKNKAGVANTSPEEK